MRKRLLNTRSRFTRNIEFRKLRSNKQDIDSSGIEHLLRGRDRSGQICVFGESCDEEHEAAGFDLHFGEICDVGGEVGVFAVGYKVLAL
jgi:hypothetical protein